MTAYRNIGDALPRLAGLIMGSGATRDSRGGDTTKEVLYEHTVLGVPRERVIVTGSRRASLVAQIAETVWVLSGKNDIEWLGRYLPRAENFSDDGKVWRGAYGPRIRHWPSKEPFGYHDQLQNVVEILKEDPTSRRAVINIFDPATDGMPGKDIPCNNWLHFMVRDGKLNLHVAVRSNDLIWGFSGINAFEWSVLLEMVAEVLGYAVGSLHFSTSSLHIYRRHWLRAEKLAIQRSTRAVAFPRFAGVDSVRDLDILLEKWLALEVRLRAGEELYGEVDSFPEPLLRSWIKIIAWHWSGDEMYLSGLRPDIQEAARNSPGAPRPVRVETAPHAQKASEESPFVEFAANLHAEKHASYGDSWKKRGEMMSIMANIARKIDRLGVSDNNETSADTAIDLLIYLMKYSRWLANSTAGGDEVNDVRDHLVAMEEWWEDRCTAPGFHPLPTMVEDLKTQFDGLETLVREQSPQRRGAVAAMLTNAYPYARSLWNREQAGVPLATNANRMFTGYNIDGDTGE